MALLASVLTPAPATAQQQQAITPKVLIGAAVSQPDSSKYSDVAEAIRRYSNNDPRGALLLLETAKRKHPKLPPTSVMLAEMHRLAGNGTAMRVALQQAVATEAGDPEPYLILAEQAIGGNRTIEADALYDKAINLIEAFDSNPKRKRALSIRAHQGRSQVHRRRRNWEQAEADLRAWIAQDPENVAAYSQLGRVLFLLERNSDGLQAFAEAKRLNTDGPNPYVTAGTVLLGQGQIDEALKYFKRAYKDDNQDQRNITQLARALLINGDTRNADKVIEKAGSDSQDSYNMLLLSGISARLQGDGSLAERNFVQALSHTPTSRDAMLQLTYLLIEEGSEDSLRRAQQYAALNSRLNEQHPDVQVALAWTLEKSSQAAAAGKTLSQVTQTNLLSPDGKLIAAKMLLTRNQSEAAKQLIDSALSQQASIFVGKAEAQGLLDKLN